MRIIPICSAIYFTSHFDRKTVSHPQENKNPHTVAARGFLRFPVWDFVAGVDGIEPSHKGVKVLCLTAWRHPYVTDSLSVNGTIIILLTAFVKEFFVETGKIVQCRHLCSSSHAAAKMAAWSPASGEGRSARYCTSKRPGSAGSLRTVNVSCSSPF